MYNKILYDVKTSPEFGASRLSPFFNLASFNIRDWSSIDTIRWGYFPNTIFFNLLCFSIIHVSEWVSHNLWLINSESCRETILNRSENPPTGANHFMSDIIAGRLAFCSMFQYSRTAFWLVYDVRIFAEFLYEISKISQQRLNWIRLVICWKLSSTTICLCTADAVNSPTMFALTIPKLVR